MRLQLLLTLFITLQALSQSALDSKINDLCLQIVDGMSDNKKTTVAVVEFSDLDGSVTDLGKFLSEEVITKLVQTKKFKVVERLLLNKVVKEQNLQITGLIDQASAKKLGKLLGVNAIISSTIADFGESVKLNARLISTESGEIFAVASTEIPKDASIRRLGGRSYVKSPKDSVQIASNPAVESKRVLVSDLSFELKSAKLLGTSIICDFTITSIEGDRRISLNISNRNDPTRIIDVDGNEFIASAGQFGDTKSRDYLIQKILTEKVPLKFKLIFENIPHPINNLALLEIQCFEQKPGGLRIKAEFRNIRLSK